MAHCCYILDDQRVELALCLQLPAQTNFSFELVGFMEEKAKQAPMGRCSQRLSDCVESVPSVTSQREEWVDWLLMDRLKSNTKVYFAWIWKLQLKTVWEMDFTVQWFPASSLHLKALHSGLSFTHSFTLSHTNAWLLPCQVLPAPCSNKSWDLNRQSSIFGPIANWTTAAYLYMQVVIDQWIQKMNEWLIFDIWHQIQNILLSHLANLQI